MAAISLTRGAISAIIEGGAMVEGLSPVLRVIEVRPLSNSQTSSERYRLMLSDGVDQHQAMIASQTAGVVRSGALRDGSIIQLTEYICNTIQTRSFFHHRLLQCLYKSSMIMAIQIQSFTGLRDGHPPIPGNCFRNRKRLVTRRLAQRGEVMRWRWRQVNRSARLGGTHPEALSLVQPLLPLSQKSPSATQRKLPALLLNYRKNTCKLSLKRLSIV